MSREGTKIRNSFQLRTRRDRTRTIGFEPKIKWKVIGRKHGKQVELRSGYVLPVHDRGNYCEGKKNNTTEE